jgi:mannitol/fructose-specific phosphotransferase system IIA component (Ntr-type)
MSFSLNELFDSKQIVLDLRATTAAEAIWEIVELLRANGRIQKAAQFYDAVMEREKKNSTAMEGGVAFPHARTNLVEQIVLGMGCSHTGVSFGESTELIHLIFVIGVPQQMVNDYLVCVGGLARRLTDKDAREALMQATTPAEFIAVLRQDS